MTRAARICRGVAAVLATAVLVAGCGGGDPEPASTTDQAAPAAGSEWSNFQSDAGHSGVSPEPTPSFPLQSAWQRTVAGDVSYPVISSGKVFVITAPNFGSQAQLVAIDQATGLDAWPPITIGTSFSASHAVHQGRVVVLGTDGILRSFDAATGAAGWSTRLTFSQGAPVTVREGKVYVTTGNGVSAVDISNGAVLWAARVSAQSSPSVGRSNVLVTSTCDAFSLAEPSGAERWRATQTPCQGGGAATVVQAGGRAFFRSYDYLQSKAVLTARDADTGIVIRSIATSAYNPFSLPAASADAVYLLNDGTLQRFDTSLQTVAWSFAGDGTLASAPLVIGDVVLIGSLNGRLSALDVRTGNERWSTLVPAAIEQPSDFGFSSIVTGMAAASGILVVPAGRTLIAWRLSSP